MARPVSRYVCQSCGAVSPKWAGRCETCGEWNTIVEEAVEARPGPGGKGAAAKPASARKIEFVGLEGTAAPPPRLVTGIAELDRVLGMEANFAGTSFLTTETVSYTHLRAHET